MTASLLNRRALLAAGGAAWAFPAHAFMPNEGPDTPKICLGPVVDTEMNARGFRRFRQIGITHVILGNSGFPWKEDDLKARVALLKAGGLTAGDIVLPYVGPARETMRDIILGRPGRDAAIDIVKSCIRAAGAAGIPVVEYNFYAHRLEEGYFHAPDPSRGGAVVESFHYDRVKDLPPLPETGAVSAERLWTNLEYFLKAVVPVAESVKVRMSLHPNDPPPHISRGNGQVLHTLKDWKRLIETVNSPSNGLTFDCGVTRELGEDPVEVARYFASRDRINHCHFRNVKLTKPNEKYVEVWNDEGDDDMFAVMKELIKNKYTRLIMPEHPRSMENDKGQKNGGYTGWVYNVGYARAMMQAALLDLRKS